MPPVPLGAVGGDGKFDERFATHARTSVLVQYAAGRPQSRYVPIHHHRHSFYKSFIMAIPVSKTDSGSLHREKMSVARSEEWRHESTSERGSDDGHEIPWAGDQFIVDAGDRMDLPHHQIDTRLRSFPNEIFTGGARWPVIC